MHNIDRTQAEAWEMSPEFDEMQGLEYGANEFDLEGLFEAEGEAYGEMGYEGPLNEADEMELAAELLEVSSEEELDQFIGKLFKKVSRGVGKVFRSPAFKSLGGALKGIAKKALPLAGGALGSLIPIPGVGTALGSAAANAAGQMFGLELEGMSAEDQEYEVARRVVRLGAEAAKQVADAPPNAPPQATAKQALTAAAQTHAPGLVGASNAPAPRSGSPAQRRRLPRAGRWMRQGRNIVLLNV